MTYTALVLWIFCLKCFPHGCEALPELIFQPAFYIELLASLNFLPARCSLAALCVIIQFTIV